MSLINDLLKDLKYENLPIDKKINFVKMKYNLNHGKGKRKRKNKNK